MFRGYLNEEERYRKCFAGGWYLTGDLAKRDARRLLLVRRPRRRRDQVVRPSDRTVRGRERADGASGGGRGRRHRQARSGRGRGRQGLRRAQARLRPPDEALRKELLGHARKRLGAAVAPKEIDFRASLPQDAQRQDHAPPAEGPRARPARGRHSRLWKATSDDRHRRRQAASGARPRAGAAAPDAAHPPLRGEMRRAVRGGEDPRLPPSLHRRGSGRGRRDAGADARRRHRRNLSRARPRIGARRPDAAIMAEMYGKREGCSRGRGGSMHLFDAATASTAATPSSAAGCRSPSASRWPTRCRRGPRHRLLLRRRRGGRGRVSRVAQPGRAVEAAGAVPLREQPLRHGHRARAPGIARPICTLKAQSYGIPSRGGRRHGRGRGGGGGATRCGGGSRGRGAAASSSAGPIASAPTRCSTPSSIATKSEVEEWKKRDPIARFGAWLRETGDASHPSDVAAIESRGRGGGRGRRRLRRSRHLGAGRDSDARRLCRRSRHDRADAACRCRTTYREAVRAAIREALRRDARVFLMGEDVGRYGGCYAVSKGLLRGVRPRAHPRHAAVRVGVRRRRHRRGAGRHAADRRDHDGQLQPAGARSDRQQRRDASATCRAASSTCRW